jgi:uncharacterized surface protein with fasciclin (FAS1) repeats
MFRKLLTLTLIAAMLGLGALVTPARAAGKARFRVGQLSTDVGPVDIVVDGKTIVPNFPASLISVYVSVNAGTHTISFSAPGKDDSGAVVPTISQELEADTDYTIYLLGLVADKTLTSLVVNDTAALADAVDFKDTTDAVAAGTENYQFVLNAMSDVKALGVKLDGEELIKDLGFGEYKVIRTPALTYKVALSFDGKSGSDVDTFNLPATYTVSAFTGPLKSLGVAAASTTKLSITDYLKLFQDPSVQLTDKFGTFEAILAGIETAKAADVLNADNSSNTIFVPNDAAWKAVGEENLKAIFGSADLMGKLLAYHVVPQTLFSQALVKATSFKTANGPEIKVSVDAKGIALNDSARILGGEVRFPNNLILYIIDAVIFPPKQ